MTLSQKDKIQVGVIGLAVLIFALALPRTISRIRQEDTAGPAAHRPASQENAGNLFGGFNLFTGGTARTVNTISADPEVRQLQKEEARRSWGRDPFFGVPIEDTRTPEQGVATPSDLLVSGVSVRGDRTMAIVNNTVVHEGEHIFGLEVRLIKSDRVVFSNNGDEITMRVGGKT